MKNTLKKVMASVMAVTSLAIGMTGMSSSAADDVKIIDRYQGPATDLEFGYGAHAYAYADSTSINVGTKAQSPSISANVRVIGLTYITYNGDFLNHTYVGEVYYNKGGSGIDNLYTKHEANGYEVTTYRSVN